MNNGHRHTDIQAYAHSLETKQNDHDQLYYRQYCAFYSPLLSFGARHYGVVPLKSALTFSRPPPPLKRVEFVQVKNHFKSEIKSQGLLKRNKTCLKWSAQKKYLLALYSYLLAYFDLSHESFGSSKLKENSIFGQLRTIRDNRVIVL